MRYEPSRDQRLADLLAVEILAGAYLPGETLPSTRETALLYDVDRTTVMNAYARLERRSLIRKQPQAPPLVRQLTREWECELKARIVHDQLEALRKLATRLFPDATERRHYCGAIIQANAACRAHSQEEP